MTGSQYAALYRCSVEDLRALAERMTATVQQRLGHPSSAEILLCRARDCTNPAERRRLYIAAFRSAHAETEHIPGNDLLSNIVEINTPKDIKNEIDALHASYEVVNQTAKGRPDWDVHYREFMQFYEKNKKPGWLNSSQSTVNNIRARAKRLEEWKRKLSSAGVQILEPEKIPDSSKNPVQGTLESATILIGVGIGALLLWKIAK